ncbi:MAG: N-acetylneuraminate synthase family protein [Proteobacteria bacterium]|nr:N-acetylneuraminate synthase family protein [Pseudomonadota bacterium]
MIPNKLIVLEMANNHMGDIAHGFKVISDFGAVCRKFPEFKFAFKLQYRELDTFIHPSMRGRDDIKYIKRFSETKLTRENFDQLVSKIREEGFLAMATPFDNASITTIVEQKLDILKIASCSFTDWPLLEEAVTANLPIIASTAGAELSDIDKVVSFLAHRNKAFAIMHCVGEYPTADEKLHINQINLLQQRYPGVRIGFSTHEDPSNTDIVKMAVAKGATIFEKHVGVETEKFALNAYSASPLQIQAWLEAARYAFTVCGVGDQRLPENTAEKASLRSLRRGVFLRHDVKAGATITNDDVYFAFPPEEGQFTANDWSKYAQFTSSSRISKDAALTPSNAKRMDTRDTIWKIAQKVSNLIKESKITVPGGIDLEISHHYGLDKFDQVGLTMFTVVNRGYCKKLLVSLPGQQHPEQYHNKKEETFHVLHGEVHISLNGEKRVCFPGEVINVEPGVRHAFVSPTGSVIEEISSTHYKDDSYYTDESIMKNKMRKTHLTYWMG